MFGRQATGLKALNHLHFRNGYFQSAVQTRPAAPPQGSSEPKVRNAARRMNVCYCALTIGHAQFRHWPPNGEPQRPSWSIAVGDFGCSRGVLPAAVSLSQRKNQREDIDLRLRRDTVGNSDTFESISLAKRRHRLFAFPDIETAVGIWLIEF